MSSDLPGWALSLARTMARDCKGPGVWLIRVERPVYSKGRTRVVIARVEVVRDFEVGARSSEPGNELPG